MQEVIWAPQKMSTQARTCPLRAPSLSSRLPNRRLPADSRAVLPAIPAHFLFDRFSRNTSASARSRGMRSRRWAQKRLSIRESDAIPLDCVSTKSAITSLGYILLSTKNTCCYYAVADIAFLCKRCGEMLCEGPERCLQMTIPDVLLMMAWVLDLGCYERHEYGALP